MYTYRPVHIDPSGHAELGTPETNAIGVYDQQLDLVAIYVHEPSKRRKFWNHVGFFLGMTAALVGLLVTAAHVDGAAMIPVIIVYLAVSALLMWMLILPDYEVNPQAELLKSAAYLTYGPTLDIVGSRKRLFKEYPPNYDTSKF